MINRNKLGLILSAFMGVFHFMWAAMVLVGIAQPLMDWIFRLHFIEAFYVIQPFNLGYAVGLILFTTATGYVSGWVLAALWNWLRMDVSTRRQFSVVEWRRHAAGH